MKTIPLTKGYVALVDDEDFARVSVYKWTLQEEKAKDGTIRNAYAAHRTPRLKGRVKLYLHRVVLSVSNPAVDVDHRDRNGLNCQKLNLRMCDRSHNLGNAKIRSDNTSGFKGVTWDKREGKWMAQIQVKGKHRGLGYFTSKEAAALAYNTAATLAFREFARINHVETSL